MVKRKFRISGLFPKGESPKEIARGLSARQVANMIVSDIEEHKLWSVISRYFTGKNERPLPIQIAKKITRLSTERTLEDFQLTERVTVADNIRNLMQQRTDLINQKDELKQDLKYGKIKASEFERRISENEKNILTIKSQIKAEAESVIGVAENSFLKIVLSHEKLYTGFVAEEAKKVREYILERERANKR